MNDGLAYTILLLGARRPCLPAPRLALLNIIGYPFKDIFLKLIVQQSYQMAHCGQSSALPYAMLYSAFTRLPILGVIIKCPTF